MEPPSDNRGSTVVHYQKILLILGLALLPAAALNGQSLIRGPYLQNGSTTAVSVRWRTSEPTDSLVRYGTSATSLTQVIKGSALVKEHELRLSGLSPNTKYFYTIGNHAKTLASGTDCFFITSPTAAKPTRIWVLGDPGTGFVGQYNVRDAYYKFTGARHTDLWLMLGDNAMNRGLESEFHSKVFGVYGAMLKKSVLWSAYGNHDADSADAATQTGPYFDLHTFPTKGEAGGVPSGTEAYFSIDYGNIHIVSLDTSESSRAVEGPMISWLKRDLAANTKDWTFVIMHHPPYTRGNTEHSDFTKTLIEARENIVPILEAHGVDMVMVGHSHCYQRSYFMNGHYGHSSTFNKGLMVVQSGNGRIDGGGAYIKDMSDKAFSGTVYMVAGCAGKTGGAGTHPVMQMTMNLLASVVLDVNGPQMDVQLIDDKGARRDYFTIKKVGLSTKPLPTEPAPQEPGPVIPPANQAPTVKLTSPLAGATFSAPASMTVTATAADADGRVTKVDFFAGGQLVGTVSSSPYSLPLNNVPAGAQTLTARATDNTGATSTCSPVLVNVSSTSGSFATVAGFTLINADTDLPVPGYENLQNGAVIVRSKLPTANLNIRVNTNPTKVGSVRIGWDGKSGFRTESDAPYALFGGPGNNYAAGVIANGTHTITATPYTQSGGGGTAGQSLSLSFSISDQAPAPAPVPAPAPAPAPVPEPVTGDTVAGFTLINADTDLPVPGFENIQSGAVIARSALPTANLNIRVNTNPTKVGSVRIGWDGKSGFRVESEAPYALFGGPGNTYAAGVIANGTHTITATPYTQSGGGGTAGKSLSLSFTISDQVPAPLPTPAPAPVPDAMTGDAVTSFTLINADTDQPVPGYVAIPNGAVISRAALPTTHLSIRVNTNPAKVGSVRIGWNSKASYRVESEAPYALFGGPADDYAAGVIANGTHTFTATPYSKASAQGVAGQNLTISFKIQ